MGDENSEADAIAAPAGNLFGSLAGAITGQAMAGPEGAIAGAIVGPMLEEVGRNVFARMLGARDRRRVEAVVTFTTEAVKRNLAAGWTIRQDDFWDARGGFAPAAQETFEAVILAAQRDPEERKLPYLANLYAYIACVPEMTPSTSHWLIKTAESLSWTQFQLLALVDKVDALDVSGIILGKGDRTWDSLSLHKELADLGAGGRYFIHGGTEALPNGAQIPSRSLASHKLLEPGRLLFAALDLEDIPASDLENIISRLRPPWTD